MAVLELIGEVLQLHAVYKEPHFFTTGHAKIRIPHTRRDNVHMPHVVLWFE